MDVLGILFVPNWIIWLGGVALLLYIYGTWPHKKLDVTGLPGPQLRPFVGSLLDQLSYPKHLGAYYLNLKKKYGPLIRLVDLRLPAIVIFDLDIVKAVLVKEHHSFTDRRNFPNRGILTNSLFDRHGETWKENRSLITPFFSSGKLKNNFEDLKHCCDNLIRSMKKACADGSPIDAKKYTGCYAMDVICYSGFGLDVDSANNPNNPFIENAKAVTDLSLESPSALLAMMFPFMEYIMSCCGVQMVPGYMVDFFTRATLETIELRLKSTQRRPDFIDAMIRAHKEEMDAENQNDLEEISEEELNKKKRKGLTRDEIIANGILLFLAGYDTSSTTLSFFMYTLAHHQDWQEKCFEEIREIIGDGDIDYESVSKLTCLDMCLDETMRILPITYLIDRVAARDVTIQGLTIPAGTSCIIPIWALHHDPEMWTDPEKFDPLRFTPEEKLTRNPYSFIPFGAGPRNCVGMRLALLEIKVGMVKILQNFRILMDGNSSFPPALARTFLVSTQKQMLLKLVQR